MKIVVIIYFDDENNYHCTLNSSCPNEYPELNEDKMECIKDEILSILENLLIYEGNEEIENYDDLLKIIENRVYKNYYTPKLNNGQDEIIQSGKLTVTLSTSQN